MLCHHAMSVYSTLGANPYSKKQNRSFKRGQELKKVIRVGNPCEKHFKIFQR